jgi:hypothetical protein
MGPSVFAEHLVVDPTLEQAHHGANLLPHRLARRAGQRRVHGVQAVKVQVKHHVDRWRALIGQHQAAQLDLADTRVGANGGQHRASHLGVELGAVGGRDAAFQNGGADDHVGVS